MLVHELAHEKRVENARGPLYHTSGNLVAPASTGLDETHVELLRQAGIQVLYEVEGSDNIERFLHECRNQRMGLEDVQPGQTLSRAIYDERGMLLLEAGKPLSAPAIERLKKRGLRVVFRRKAPDEMELPQYERYVELLAAQKEADSDVVDQAVRYVSSRSVQPPDAGFTPDWVEDRLQKDLPAEPAGPPLKERIKQKDTTVICQQDGEKSQFIGLHHDAIILTRRLFEHVRQSQNFDGAMIGKLAGDIVYAIINDKDMLLNLVNIKGVEDYLVYHSVNVCLISVNIATAMGLATEQVIEIAYGALLHDLGMLRIPNEILEKSGPLTETEKLEVQKHPVFGLDLLQRVKGIPTTTPYVAYQSHERLDKSGYVRQKEGKQIHLYAKIVAVADVYEALTSERSYRKAFLPYQAMEQVISMGNKRKLDPEVIRAFLRYMSLFPVGSWVQLNNESIGKVVSANESNYDRPVIRLIYDAQKKKLISPVLIDLKNADNLRVERVVDASELETTLMEGF